VKDSICISKNHPDSKSNQFSLLHLSTMATAPVFRANPQTLGMTNFKLINIDPEETAKAFQDYIDTGSKLTGVSLDDIKTGVRLMPTDPKVVPLAELLEKGMKLFDAIVWLTAGRPASHPLVLDPTITVQTTPSMHEIARSVFYCYFMLLTQARYPVPANEVQKPVIPNFLKTIMGMTEPQDIYVGRICSFNPNKFDPKWIRYVTFGKFGQEALSRFGLGVAGYRLFAPFKLYQPKIGLSPNLLNAFEFAKAVATARPSWQVHPLTRNPQVLTARGNLNKNLSNLMLEVFSTEDLAEMAATKVIYKVPTREANHVNYRTWGPADDITGTDFIFPVTN